MGDTVQHGNRQDDQNRSWQHLNLSGQLGNPWPKGRQRGQNDQKQRRVLLVAVNMPGYYSLAVRILALVVAQNPALASQVDIRYVELDNNADMQGAASLLAAWQPECIAWTVNIWNRMQVELLLRKLRPLLPQALFLFGGQEVTNSAVDFLQLLPELDYLIEGKGACPGTTAPGLVGKWPPHCARSLRGFWPALPQAGSIYSHQTSRAGAGFGYTALGNLGRACTARAAQPAGGDARGLAGLPQPVQFLL